MNPETKDRMNKRAESDRKLRAARALVAPIISGQKTDPQVETDESVNQRVLKLLGVVIVQGRGAP